MGIHSHTCHRNKNNNNNKNKRQTAKVFKHIKTKTLTQSLAKWPFYWHFCSTARKRGEKRYNNKWNKIRNKKVCFLPSCFCILVSHENGNEDEVEAKPMLMKQWTSKATLQSIRQLPLSKQSPVSIDSKWNAFNYEIEYNYSQHVIKLRIANYIN